MCLKLRLEDGIGRRSGRNAGAGIRAICRRTATDTLARRPTASRSGDCPTTTYSSARLLPASLLMTAVPARLASPRRRIELLVARIRQKRDHWREVRRLQSAGRELAARLGETDHLAALAAESARSVEADRADQAQVDAWMQPVVAVRGLTTRMVLRHRIARGHRQLRGRYEALARTAEAGSITPTPPVGMTAGAASLTDARVEATRFGRAFWAQLRPAILPKAPALAGLAVGWWIANTYTDSRWKSLARSIGSGGTQVVSAETYRAMSFWLPLLAAAVCAYLGDRIAAAWHKRREV